MSSNLTSITPENSFSQLLHVDGGPDASLKTVYSGAGVATALKVSTAAVAVDNLKFDGNAISSTDTNGNITLSPNGSGAVVIDNVDINGGSVTGITPLAVAYGGTGSATASDARTALGLGTMATQSAGSVAITGGTMTGVAMSGSFTGITLIGLATLQASSSIGYAAGGGGTVTQATSKSTGVTLNKPSGQITMNNAALGATTAVSFTLTNSSIAATDVVIASIASGGTAAAYSLIVDAISAGSCQFSLYNRTAGSLGEALVINFAVIKGSSS